MAGASCGPAADAVMEIGNDSTNCDSSPIAITSIDIDYERLGYAAMKILDEMMRRPVAPKPRPVLHMAPGEICERESTAVYPIDPPWLGKVMLLLDSRPDYAFQAAELAEAGGVSQSTLNTTFRDRLGMSVGSYMTSVRMREARRLLDEGSLSVKEIAARTGFASQSYFGKAFRTFYGKSPGAYASRRTASLKSATRRPAAPSR